MNTISVNRQGTVQTESVAPGTTIGSYLRSKSISLQGNFVRVNNDGGSVQVTASNMDTLLLNQGDQVSITPTKQAAARR